MEETAEENCKYLIPLLKILGCGSVNNDLQQWINQRKNNS
jgi:Tfp pilus assembly protein PilP